MKKSIVIDFFIANLSMFLIINFITKYTLLLSAIKFTDPHNFENTL